MPIKLIPDLEWEFIENIGVMESDKGVTIYCIKEVEDEHEDTQVTEVSEPKTDVKTTNIKPRVTETVEAPGATQTSGDINTTETEEPRYEHRENPEIAAEDAVPKETTEETELTGNTGISQAILVDPTEDTETTDVSEQTVAEQVEVTHTIDITELVTGIPEPTLEATSKENEESTTTPPGSPQRENPEVQNKNRYDTEVNAEQAVKKTHKYPKANNSIVNKIFSVFRQAKESIEAIPL